MPPTRVESLPPDDAERALDLARMLAAARAAWPGLCVGDGDFARYITARANAARVADLHATDLYLACACAGGDAIAIKTFDRHYLGELTQQLARTGVARAIADDAVQALRARLFVADGGPAKINEYSGRGPIGAWLRVAAVRLVSNLRRGEATRAAATVGAHPPVAMPAVDPETAAIQRRYGEPFNRSFADAFGSLTAEERSVLRLHFVDGLNLARIADALGMSRATAGRRMLAARERLLAETLRLLGERLEATPTELASLLAVVRSKLDVSLGGLLLSSVDAG